MVIKQSSLRKIIKGLKWTSKKNLPFSQGFAINFLIKRYKINAKRWGYSPSSSHVGLETTKQYLLWKDTGTSLQFVGIVNKTKRKR